MWRLCKFGPIWIYDNNLKNSAKNCSMLEFKLRPIESEIFRNGSISRDQRWSFVTIKK